MVAVIQLLAIRAALVLSGVCPGCLSDIAEMANKPGLNTSRASDEIRAEFLSLTGPAAAQFRADPSSTPRVQLIA